MIPTYESDEKLAVALRSVLTQAPGPEAMQIAVVDDASPSNRIEQLVKAVDSKNRIQVIRNEQRLGLCGNWNRAISLAQGRLVHLLHQDDYVHDGFYERMKFAFQSAPQIGMAFCRSRFVDGEDRYLKTSSRERWTAGILDRWIYRIGVRQRIQTPAAVVARSTYEAIGGYLPELRFALDWEMWVRIAARFEVWYEPTAACTYRRHTGNETTRLWNTGAIWPDLIAAIEINSRSFPEVARNQLRAKSLRWNAHSAVRTAFNQYRYGEHERAYATLTRAKELFERLDDSHTFDLTFHRMQLLERRLIQQRQSNAA